MSVRRDPWWLPILIAAASLMVSGFVAYYHNDKVIAERVTRLETHQTDDSSRLDRIESKLDQLLLYLGAVSPSRHDAK